MSEEESNEQAEDDPNNITVPCCSEEVHIAFRGRADDRLYISYNRQWQELKFFQSNGLKVFCATCRQRVY